ncbi:GspE/PulE family protein [Vibrio europaeus]|uniref:GspE/PulE family protein n=1 Tax=Vibrio europaeus TaxID=300876 RepID=UPI00233F70CC|nr:ATPase, T2SS/T4P/T4SS family [Vibrio europaeus]MDC5711156.1 ATPase, T2SS/T4P/T4SS family [Vibrio europaeus]MDC5713185.1 ATPase, T2SS/T4P/T4SS family [Vibrio europaeus]
MESLYSVVQTEELKSIYFLYQDTVLIDSGEIHTSNYDSEAINAIKPLVSDNPELLPDLNGQHPRVIKVSQDVIDSQISQLSNSDYLKVDKQKLTTTGKNARLMLQEAVNRGSSDIHLEVYKAKTEINVRVDGRMIELQKAVPEKEYGDLLVGYIFNEATVKETDFYLNKPNNGKLEIELQTEEGIRECNWRLSWIPAKDNGGQLTMRWLNKDQHIPDISELGWEPGHVQALVDFSNSASGCALIAGQVGSGKSTSMAAIIESMKGTGRSINTLEDPVEFDIGIIQTTVKNTEDDEDAFFEFSKLLLRHDVDIEGHGEVREAKGAKSVCRKSETGQIMLSTLHTSSAVGIAHTLIEQMDVPISLVTAPNLMKLWIYQTLVRQLCPHCCLTKADALEGMTDREQELLNTWYTSQESKGVNLNNVRFKNPQGCEKCTEGEKGRTLLVEMLVLDDEDRRYILKQDYLGWIEALRKKGFKDIQSHANLKIRRGLIDLFTTSNRVDGLIEVSTSKVYDSFHSDE